MSHIIAMSSVRPDGASMVFVQSSELTHETLFCLDRVMREVVSKSPRAEWPAFESVLAREGFACVSEPGPGPVFVHSRPWDEHLVAGAQSFFVAFPEDAPYELAGRLMLASANPWLYTGVSADYSRKNGVVLVNGDHDPVYPDDLAWCTPDHEDKKPIGPVRLVREQFFTDAQYEAALASLAASGYEPLAAGA